MWVLLLPPPAFARVGKVDRSRQAARRMGLFGQASAKLSLYALLAQRGPSVALTRATSPTFASLRRGRMNLYAGWYKCGEGPAPYLIRGRAAKQRVKVQHGSSL